MNNESPGPLNNGLNQPIEEFLSSNYKFRFNTVLGRTEFHIIGESKFQELKDFDLNSLSLQLERQRTKCSVDKLRKILNSNFVVEYDPFKDIIDNLPEYDNNRDFINELASTVLTSNQNLWEKCLKKWIVAWVASMNDNNITNQTVIILEGKQGIGKSKWISKLLPENLKTYIYSGTINPENKDTLIYLSECALINLDELESLNRNQQGSLKELITKDKIKLRRPYGYNAENLPRRASFVGSVNTNEFLTDTTGNRRFLCFEALEINYEHKVDMILVFAQALHLFKNGFQFWFDKNEIAEINKSNEKFRQVSIEEETLISLYEPSLIDQDAKFLTNTEILNNLSAHVKLAINQGARKRLGEALHRHGYARVKKGGRYVYKVSEIVSPTGSNLNAV